MLTSIKAPTPRLVRSSLTVERSPSKIGLLPKMGNDLDTVKCSKAFQIPRAMSPFALISRERSCFELLGPLIRRSESLESRGRRYEMESKPDPTTPIPSVVLNCAQ